MSLTVYTQSTFYYNSYVLTGSERYRSNAVDSTKISEDSYNISDMTNALEALDTGDTVDFNFLGNISSYAKNLYSISQWNFFDGLSSSNTKVGDILANDTDLSGIYSMMGSNNLISKQYYTYILDNTDADTAEDIGSRYSDYLSGKISGNVLDASA